jgi:hypothetical protein
VQEQRLHNNQVLVFVGGFACHAFGGSRVSEVLIRLHPFTTSAKDLFKCVNIGNGVLRMSSIRVYSM